VEKMTHNFKNYAYSPSWEFCLIIFVRISKMFLTGCGHCKRLKPDFSLAATHLKGTAVS